VVLDESDGTHFYHLFNRLPGNVVYIWKDICSFAQMRSIMTILAKLHAALAEYPITDQKPPLTVIQNQIDGIKKTTKWIKISPLLEQLADKFTRFFTHSEKLIANVRNMPWKAATSQWAQGDFQLENLLFTEDEVTDLVDFDNAR